MITTSGALAAVLLGLATLARGTDSRLVLPDDASGWVVGALAAFFAAAFFAVLTNLPLGYRSADLSDLGRLIEADEESAMEALRIVVDNRLKVLARAATVNDVKAWFLVLAMAAEILGIAVIGYAGWLVI